MNRLDIESDSFVDSRTRVTCWIQVKAAETTAARSRPPIRPTMIPFPWRFVGARTSLTSTWRKAGRANPGTMSPSPASRHMASAPRAPRSREARPRTSDGSDPLGSKSGPGTKVITTPVKA